MPFTLIRIVLVAVCCAVACRHFVHMLQLESYQLPGYRRWMSRNRDRQLKNLLVGFSSVVLSWYLPVFFSLFITERVRRESVAQWAMLALFVAVTAVLAVFDLQMCIRDSRRGDAMRKSRTQQYTVERTRRHQRDRQKPNVFS